MRWFVIGFWLVQALGAGIVLATDQPLRPNPAWVLAFLLNTCVVPVAVAWAVAELVHACWPRRCLAAGTTAGPIGLLTRGAAAGILGASLTIVALAFIDRAWPDAWVTGPGAAVATGLFTVCARRIRPGRCVRCSYDLGGLTPASGGVCPECGAGVLAPGESPRRAAA